MNNADYAVYAVGFTILATIAFPFIIQFAFYLIDKARQ